MAAVIFRYDDPFEARLRDEWALGVLLSLSWSPVSGFIEHRSSCPQARGGKQKASVRARCRLHAHTVEIGQGFATAHPKWEELLSQVNEINWAAELKKIEREFDGLPPEPSPAVARAKMESGRHKLEQRRQQEAAIGVYIRLVLVLALGVSIVYWPYSRTCGASLFLYMSSVSLVVIGGLWISASTWQNRMPRTHLLSMVILLWGLALSALEILPRAGYAQPDPQRAAWYCE